MSNEGISREELLSYQVESTMADIRKDPLVLYGIFTELTCQLFAVDGFSDVRWDRDPKKSGIYIAPEYVWDDVTVEKRPAVFISLQPLEFSTYSDRHGGKVAMDLKEGTYDYARRIVGTVQWIVIGETKGEALKIGTDILNYVDAFSDVIAKDFCFEEFGVTQFKPVDIVKEARERIRTTLTARFVVQETWSLKQESPKLKEIHFRTGQHLAGLIRS